ncbi:MAG TPA: transketolase C-terminal domain-containing protein [Bryobacteraceae bacterium]|jgi:transketolase|nr:transketolase C-terminal domain-containing protein [Bryobacteraceae bacterium]
MRTAFIRTLVELAEQDERVTLVVGDLGFGVVEAFASKFPKRFVNAGVAEQNMTAIAAGMALSGKIVFTYSIANFPTLRCFEQIRNDICYHNAKVIVVSVGGGLAYGALGMTHHATEDIAVMRALPGMTVIAPGDPLEAELATRALVAQPGPAYLRLGRSGEPPVHPQPALSHRLPEYWSGAEFQLGQAIQLCDGGDLTLIATGTMLHSAARVRERLRESGVHARLLSMHTIKPLDVNAILAAARETRAIVTLEEHSITGGLGSAVAEILAESAAPKVPFKRLGLPPKFTSLVGSQDYLKEAYSLTVDGILAAVAAVLNRPSASPLDLTRSAAFAQPLHD